jgi:hypothetical protein
MTHEFSVMHKRAGDNPSAIKLAMRMASALASSPKEVNGSWLFSIDSPKDDPNYPVAKQLLTSALLSVDSNFYFDWEVEQGRGTEGNKLLVKTHRSARHPFPTERPVIPTHEINHHLKRIQDALSSEWVKDTDGKFRHTKTFEKYGARAMGHHHKSIDPSTFRDLLCELMPESAIDDTRLFNFGEHDRQPLPPIGELPKNGTRETHLQRPLALLAPRGLVA